MEKKQSSIDWLVEQIKKDINLRLRGFDIDKALEQAKAMHRKEIQDAYGHGSNNGYMYANDKNVSISKERYYEQEFQNND